MATIDVDALERRLWSSADTLRANSSYASNEYFMPIMGLIFLRHAYSRFKRVEAEIAASRPKRGGVPLPMSPAEFKGRGAIYLGETARYPYLVGLPDSADRPRAVREAMESIEADYETLRGQLPKDEYGKLDDDVMEQLLRTFGDPELDDASGDVFGRIYEYFLNKFASDKAHDGGEFYTPVSLVQTIVGVIEPARGRVLDPACGSGGMFVQSAHFVEAQREDPTKRLTFYGFEKNETTIKLGKMNLAVHGLEGQVQKAISYYPDDDLLGLVGEMDYVMANPPFNVDEVVADKIKADPRLPFGLPGVSTSKKRKGRVSNANYLWASYFYSYLTERGRAGFVMSSQASSAGGDEAKVRQALVETGHVDAMMAIRGGFFYTRTVPCELWFYDKGTPEQRQDSVLMIDARHTHRKVSRTVYDFSPEQLQNLTSIVWLYREQPQRFAALAARHLRHAALAALDAFGDNSGQALHPGALVYLEAALQNLDAELAPFLEAHPEADRAAALTDALEAYQTARAALRDGTEAIKRSGKDALGTWHDAQHGDGLDATSPEEIGALWRFLDDVAAPLADQARALAKTAERAAKAAAALVDALEADETAAKKHAAYKTRDVGRARKDVDATRRDAAAQLARVRYFARHARWLRERFPEARLRDVPGLVKVASRAEIAANDWSLTPGRYVGVAPPEVDEDFDFDEAMQAIREDLRDLDAEAAALAATIDSSLEELGV